MTERPDWACEILSPSTARQDVGPKKRTLHAHDVPHYWIVDPANMLPTVMRVRRSATSTFSRRGVGDVVRAEPFEEIELAIAETFGVEE